MEKNEKVSSAYEPDSLGATSRRRKMAMPKPIRLLAAACMALFLFLMVQMIRSPTALKPPGSGGGDGINDMIRDPNLDGAAASQSTTINNG